LLHLEARLNIERDSGDGSERAETNNRAGELVGILLARQLYHFASSVHDLYR
jgi:hypothetical protein